MRKKVKQTSAFTLLELLIVIALIAGISMAIVPIYVSSMNGIRLRNARNDLIAAIRYAQEMAVRESREYRVYFDSENGTYRVEVLVGLDKDEKVFEPAQTLLGAEQQLPPFLVIDRIEARRDRHTREHFIACLPNGASDKATVRLRDSRIRGSKMTIEIEGPMGRIKVEDVH